MSSDAITSEISRQEKRTQFLREVQLLKENDPEYYHEFVKMLNGQSPSKRNKPVSAAPVAKNGHSPTYEMRIKEFFASRGNKACTLTEIMKGTGISRNGVSRIVYKPPTRSLFAKRANPKNKNAKLWRLTLDAFQDLKERSR